MPTGPEERPLTRRSFLIRIAAWSLLLYGAGIAYLVMATGSNQTAVAIFLIALACLDALLITYVARRLPNDGE